MNLGTQTMDCKELENRRGAILVIDDDEADRTFTLRCLAKVMPKATVEVCEDGDCALERLVTMANPDSPQVEIVFMDQRMPGRQGLEIMELIQGTGLTERVPVVLFSSAVPPSEVQAILAAGARGYIMKPVDPELYREAIATALSRYLA